MAALRASKPEWAMLGGLMLLAATVLVSFGMWRAHRRLYALVQSDLDAIAQAAQRFYEEYGVWPTEQTERAGDMRYGRERPNHIVMDALRGVGALPAMNPYRIVFLEMDTPSRGGLDMDELGNFLDPWGQPYQLVLDADLNGHCDVESSIYKRVFDRGIAVWSCGPDGLSDTKDDVLGWER